MKSSTASTNSACCSTATARTPATWFGSQLLIQETRELAPYQNATALQVTSAIIGGMVWALEHPNEGIVEAELKMDFHRLLEIQLPYLGPVRGVLRLDAARWPSWPVPRRHRH